MFTGIVEELGTVKSLDSGSIVKLQVGAAKTAESVQVGQSVCVNGVCLTVVEAKKDLLCFELIPETLRNTNLGLLKKADKVNLERALRLDSRLDGHFVNGHIDSQGVIKRIQKKGSDVTIEIEPALEQSLHYITRKGSVALDGVSLTVSNQGPRSFQVSLIPYTLQNTTLGLKREKDSVNIECDILAKYAQRCLSQAQQPVSNITSAFLKEHGFI